jgi:hypothetical protein
MLSSEGRQRSIYKKKTPKTIKEKKKVFTRGNLILGVRVILCRNTKNPVFGALIYKAKAMWAKTRQTAFTSSFPT